MAVDPSQTTQIPVAIIGFGGVILGALISGGFMFWGQTLTRRSEERRQRRELAINTALAQWKNDIETAKFRAEKSGINGAIAPLDLYIIHMIRLSDLIDRESLTEKEIATELRNIGEATRTAYDAAIEKDKKEGRYPFHDSPNGPGGDVA